MTRVLTWKMFLLLGTVVVLGLFFGGIGIMLAGYDIKMGGIMFGVSIFIGMVALVASAIFDQTYF